jgi:hypothetical protein
MLVAGGLSAFNFLFDFPVFHILTVLALLIAVVTFILRGLRGFVLRDNVSLMSMSFVLLSIPSYLLSVYFNSTLISLPFFYFVIFYATLLLNNNNLDEDFIVSLFKYVLFSAFLITIYGWLIRVGFVAIGSSGDDAINAEMLLGYWGIRYEPSTRNSDFLYPLLGSAIALFSYMKTKKLGYLMLIVFFNFTMIMSLSRAALIIALLSFLFTFLSSSKLSKLLSLIFSVVLIAFNYEFLTPYYDVFSSIFASIFSFESPIFKYSNSERMDIASLGLHAAIFNPVGYGVENYKIIYDIFGSEMSAKSSGENAFLTILVERGWGALVSIILLLVFAFKNAFKVYKKYGISDFNLMICPYLLVFMIFNYELNGIYLNYIFFLILLSNLNIMMKNNKKLEFYNRNSRLQ